MPAGTARLRMTVMATHEAGELRRAAQVVGDAARELGLVRTAPVPVPQAEPSAARVPEAAPAEHFRRAA